MIKKIQKVTSECWLNIGGKWACWRSTCLSLEPLWYKVSALVTQVASPSNSRLICHHTTSVCTMWTDFLVSYCTFHQTHTQCNEGICAQPKSLSQHVQGAQRAGKNRTNLLAAGKVEVDTPWIWNEPLLPVFKTCCTEKFKIGPPMCVVRHSPWSTVCEPSTGSSLSLFSDCCLIKDLSE